MKLSAWWSADPLKSNEGNLQVIIELWNGKKKHFYMVKWVAAKSSFPFQNPEEVKNREGYEIAGRKFIQLIYYQRNEQNYYMNAHWYLL